MRTHLFLLLMIVITATSQLVGQEKIIHGKITTFDSIPLIGVSVQVKSTKQIFKTDTVGMFSAFCNRKDKLKISAKGFFNQNVKVEDDTKYIFINMNLKPGRENREFAIGYGHVKDKDRLYSISSLNSDQLQFSQYNNIYEIIRGRFPGVEIKNGDIIIRGTSTFLGSDAALLVVDGVIVDRDFFSSLLPVEISSINVLKDASASAYGSRGANGVVIVETRKGGDK